LPLPDPDPIVVATVYHIDSEVVVARKKLGYLESSVLIAVVEESESAFALEIRRAIKSATGRAVSRGAFYTTLERLGQKGLVSWENQVPPNARRELAQRRYAITPAGMRALEETKAELAAQWQRLADATGES
jgi:DNA-binding PadR family transcriptional regulator